MARRRLQIVGGGDAADKADITIRVVTGQSWVGAEEARHRLIDAHAPLFQRSGMLVTPSSGFFKLRSEIPDGSGGLKSEFVDYPTTYACEVGTYDLFPELEKIAVWEKFDKREKSWVRCDPDKRVLNILLAGHGQGFPVLSSITTIPFILHDNLIIGRYGYHEPSGVFLALDDGLAMPAVPERIGFEEAKSAADLLQGLLAEFPFVSEVDLAVAMSALITPVARKAMDVAPLHAVSAPMQGTGKSYLTDIASAIRTGSTMPSQGARDDLPGELDKGLTAAILRDAPMLSIDNVTDALSSPLLAQIIERGRVCVRLFGELRDVEITNSICLYASGNNIRVRNDLGRRTLLCRLDREMEHPEHFAFESRPVRTVLLERGRYVSACLAVARFGLQNGAVDGLKPLNSFEDWSRCVREPLIRLGYADCVDSQKFTEEDDPQRDTLTSFIERWIEHVGWQRKLSVSALGAVDGMRSICVEVAPDRHGGVSNQKLGHYLAQNKGRVCCDAKITKVGHDRKEGNMWMIKPKL